MAAKNSQNGASETREIQRLLKETAADLRIVAKAQKRTVDTLEKIATERKADIAERRAELRAEAAERKKEAAKYKAELRAELRAEAAERKKEAAQHKAELRSEAAARKKESAERKAELRAEAAGRKAAAIERDKEMRQLRRHLGGISDTQGEIAEDLFRRNFIGAMRAAGIKLNHLRAPLPGAREYDILGFNGKCAVVAEVKARLSKRHINRFLRALPGFYAHFPEYRGKALHGAVAGLSVKEDAEQFAADNGLYILTQTDAGGAAVKNPKGFKARVF